MEQGRMPKDYLLAERAYNAFWNEQPQIFFDQLASDYQQRWVRAIRGAIEGHKSYQHREKHGVLVGSESVVGREPGYTKAAEALLRVLAPEKAKANGNDTEAPYGRKKNGKPYKTSAAARKRASKTSAAANKRASQARKDQVSATT